MLNHDEFKYDSRTWTMKHLPPTITSPVGTYNFDLFQFALCQQNWFTVRLMREIFRKRLNFFVENENCSIKICMWKKTAASDEPKFLFFVLFLLRTAHSAEKKSVNLAIQKNVSGLLITKAIIINWVENVPTERREKKRPRSCVLIVNRLFNVVALAGEDIEFCLGISQFLLWAWKFVIKSFSFSLRARWCILIILTGF